MYQIQHENVLKNVYELIQSEAYEWKSFTEDTAIAVELDSDGVSIFPSLGLQRKEGNLVK